MLRASVPWSLAILLRLSPRTTRYTKNVGWGVGVGRTNERGGVGPAGVGSGVTVAAAPALAGAPVVGSGTHPTRMTNATTRDRAATVPDAGTRERMSSTVT